MTTPEEPVEDTPATDTRRGFSRRRLFRLAGAGAAGVAVAGVTGGVIGRATAEASDSPTASATGEVAFHGGHQAGIVTPAQDRLHFVSFDVITDDREVLAQLLRDWTDAARRMTAGQDAGPVGAVGGSQYSPPDDTGEAIGLPPSGLTLTVGFGPPLFTAADGTDRFSLAARRPAALTALPAFSGEEIRPEISDGDLCVQACANDPQVAVHAIRNLARIGQGIVSVRWSQLGFGRTSSTSTGQATPRNLFGMKDGTDNLKAENTDTLDDFVWVADGDDPAAAWLAGGSYLVSRRIRMLIEVWDRQTLQDQEQTIGRTKPAGAPLSGGTEYTAPDFAAKGDGAPLIATDAHVRLAHPKFNGGAQLLRRGYNYADGNDSLGRLNAGLFFMAYQRDARTQFIPIQQRLASSDKMNEYVVHVGSGMFAVPPGATPGSYVGAPLFA